MQLGVTNRSTFTRIMGPEITSGAMTYATTITSDCTAHENKLRKILRVQNRDSDGVYAADKHSKSSAAKKRGDKSRVRYIRQCRWRERETDGGGQNIVGRKLPSIWRQFEIAATGRYKALFIHSLLSQMMSFMQRRKHTRTHTRGLISKLLSSPTPSNYDNDVPCEPDILVEFYCSKSFAKRRFVSSGTFSVIFN